jgi:hypothetical protein
MGRTGSFRHDGRTTERQYALHVVSCFVIQQQWEGMRSRKEVAFLFGRGSSMRLIERSGSSICLGTFLSQCVVCTSRPRIDCVKLI